MLELVVGRCDFVFDVLCSTNGIVNCGEHNRIDGAWSMEHPRDPRAFRSPQLREKGFGQRKTACG